MIDRMPLLTHRSYLPPTATVAAALLAAAAAGCGASGGATASAAPVTGPTAPVRTVAAIHHHSTHRASKSRIDQLTVVARKRWATERYGSATHQLLRNVAADPGLRRAAGSGNEATLRTYVRARFARVWYHEHVSRMRILRGSNVVVDAGVPFVVGPSSRPLLDQHGKKRGTLEVSIQDVIGFVRYMHRNYPVDVVARGVGKAHVRTSLPAALRVKLPDSGSATIAGRRYQVRSFTQKALRNEHVKVWILTHA